MDGWVGGSIITHILCVCMIMKYIHYTTHTHLRLLLPPVPLPRMHKVGVALHREDVLHAELGVGLLALGLAP